MITHYNFYGFNGYKKGKCVVCGKHGELQQRFEQSISPFNPKTPTQIYQIEGEKIKAWQQEPFVHRRCENSLVKPSPEK